MNWAKLPAIEGGHGGCLNCGGTHSNLDMNTLLAGVLSELSA